MPATVLHFRTTKNPAPARLSDRDRLIEYLEGAVDIAFLKFRQAAKQYPGIEWAHVTEPLKRDWLDYEAALVLARSIS